MTENQALDGLAQMAYHQYGAVTGGKNYQGLPMPDYADLGETIRSAWQAAAGAVARAVTVGHDLVRDFAGPRPEIVVLCGSTRFGQTFREQNLLLTLRGVIVLSIGCDTKSDDDLTAAGGMTDDLKTRLDELHLRKIDLADRVLVLDVGGYIGESTRREIVYAERLGKPIGYLSATVETAR